MTRDDLGIPPADIVYVGFLLGHGGDALQMLSLATGMQDRGARVGIVVPAHEHSVTFAARCEEAGVECVRTPLLTAELHGSRQRLRSLVRLFRSIEAPIVHFHTGNSVLPRSATLALELLRYRPGFVTLQSPYETVAPGSARARYWAFEARRRFLAVVSPSDHATRFQMQCGVPRDVAVTIRNSIDVDALAGGDPAVARAALGVGAEVPLVLFTSRIDAQKRPIDAVRIFAAVAADIPTALLVFVGSGDEQQAVTDEAHRLGLADRVRLAGYQTNIADWLAAATVWLLPTERENFSVAVIEALAAGCPVVATDCPGNDEVLVDGANSLTFPVGDIEAGGQRLGRLLGDADLRRRLNDGARASAKAYSVDRMVDAYRAIYERCRPPDRTSGSPTR